MRCAACGMRLAPCGLRRCFRTDARTERTYGKRRTRWNHGSPGGSPSQGASAPDKNKTQTHQTVSLRLQSAEDGRAVGHWVLPHRARTKRVSKKQRAWEICSSPGGSHSRGASAPMQEKHGLASPQRKLREWEGEVTAEPKKQRKVRHTEKHQHQQQRAGSVSWRRKTSKSIRSAPPGLQARGSPTTRTIAAVHITRRSRERQFPETS